MVEGAATFPLIKEMANFVEPHLPPGFRTRLRAAVASIPGRSPCRRRPQPPPSQPLRTAKPTPRRRQPPAPRRPLASRPVPNRRSELSLMALQAVPRYNPAVSSDPRTPRPDDKFHEECGVVRHLRDVDAAAHTALGLHALQHRGQEASGIVTFDGSSSTTTARPAWSATSSASRRSSPGCKGYSAIGHNRYATTGGSSDRNIQPIFADFDFGGLAIAHNGNLTNAYLLRKELVRTRLPVPVDHRHRGHQPPDRPLELLDRGRPHDRRAGPGEGRLFAAAADQRGADRRARPDGRAPAGASAGSTMPGSWRRRPARSTSSAPASCATSSPARS